MWQSGIQIQLSQLLGWLLPRLQNIACVGEDVENKEPLYQIRSDQSLSRVRLFATP